MSEGLWLGIETSGRGGGVALVRDGGVVVEHLLPVVADTSEKVLPAVRDAMESADASPGDLEGIGVSMGPGSYTGLRIGVATALGLSRGWGVGVAGVPTLEVLAAGTGLRGTVLTAVEARRGEVFASAYRVAPGPRPEELFPAAAYTAGAVREWAERARPAAAVGTGRRQLGELGGVWVRAILDSPRPAAVAALARDRAGRGGFDDHLEPLYLRGFMGRALSEVRPRV